MPAGWLRFFAAVVLIQGIHVFEHFVQLYQVFVLRIPDDNALGLLGYVFQLQGTEEWLHFVFNTLYVASLYLLLIPLRRLGTSALGRAFTIFLIGGVGLESWHYVEHLVIVTNVLRNSGCPCPGIIDSLTPLTDTVAHFFYNLVAYGSTLPAFFAVLRLQGIGMTPAGLLQAWRGSTKA